MLQFKQSDTGVRIILTLTELATLSEPFYLFVFTHVTTKAQVVFVKSSSDDFSNYKQRYNEFAINPAELFEGKDVGEWHYIVYEQDNQENLDPVETIGIVEKGKLYLNRENDFAYSMYEQSVTFKTYNG